MSRSGAEVIEGCARHSRVPGAGRGKQRAEGKSRQNNRAGPTTWQIADNNKHRITPERMDENEVIIFFWGGQREEGEPKRRERRARWAQKQKGGAPGGRGRTVDAPLLGNFEDDIHGYLLLQQRPGNGTAFVRKKRCSPKRRNVSYCPFSKLRHSLYSRFLCVVQLFPPVRTYCCSYRYFALVSLQRFFGGRS